jgi:dephospho-CoA kinase
MQQTEPPTGEPGIKIIGLTGGIGSGKTTVAHFIEKMGFPVYYSDDRAKTIVNDSVELKQRIIALLGKEAYDENGLYDRKYVSNLVFNNNELLSYLNGIIHPAVALDFKNWVLQQKNYLIFKETALLFELKLNLQCYKSLLVTADDNIRAKRVMDRDGKTYREVKSIMEKQMSEKEKIRFADYVIYNNTDLQDLEKQTEEIVLSIS